MSDGPDAATIVASAIAAAGLAALAIVVVQRRAEEPEDEPDATPSPGPTPVNALTGAPGDAAPEPEEPPPTSPATTPPAPVEPAPEPPPAPAPPTLPSNRPSPAPNASCLTAPEDIGEPVWTSLGTNKEIAVLIPDLATGGFAHASKASALAVAAKYGASLPTHEDMLALADQAKAAGFELDPVILPGASAELKAEDAQPGGPGMTTARWAKISDDLIRQQLTSRAWDGKTAVANVGKVWLDAPEGQVHLMGWRQHNGTWIQSGTDTGEGAHAPSYTDYSMYLTLVRPLASA